MTRVPRAFVNYILVLPAAVWVALFLAVPVILLTVISFFPQVEGGGYTPGFTLDNYATALGTYSGIIVTTVVLGLEMVIITLVLGYPMAYYMAIKVRNARVRTMILMSLIIPFWIDWNARTLAWFPILGKAGVVNFTLISLGVINQPLSALLFTQTSLFFVWIQAYVLFMVTPIYLSLIKMDQTLLDAAKMLGAPPHKIFYHVTLKLSLPGVVVGVIFILISVMGDYATPLIFGGGLSTVGSVIQSYMTFLYFPFAAAVGTVLTLITFLFIYILLRFVDIKKLIW